MIKINGSFEKLKAEMKLHKEAAEQELRQAKKDAKEKHVNLEPYEIKRSMYLQSKTMPVRIKGLVLNYKLLQAFLKKIKRFPAEMTIGENFLRVDYETNKSPSGSITLYDLSSYYASFKHIPDAEIEQEGS